MFVFHWESGGGCEYKDESGQGSERLWVLTLKFMSMTTMLGWRAATAVVADAHRRSKREDTM